MPDTLSILGGREAIDGRLDLIARDGVLAERGPGATTLNASDRLGNLDVPVEGMVASRADCGLAGSVLQIDRAVRNLGAITGCTIERAVATVTTHPTALLHLTDRGSLETGHGAGGVLLDPDAQVAATIAAGHIACLASPDRLTGRNQ